LYPSLANIRFWSISAC